MRKLILFTALVTLCGLVSSLPVRAQDHEKTTTEIVKKVEKPLPAKTIISAASSKAKKSHKNVLVMFHATW